MFVSRRGAQARLIVGLVAFLAVLGVALGCAAGAHADGTLTWGPSGENTPSLDTANGDYVPYSTASPQVNPFSGANTILPGAYAGENKATTYHSAEDLAVWNPSYTAPQSGQVLAVKLTGCAVEDTSSPSQDSQGTPVNTALFQTLTPSGANWNSVNVSGQFLVPFCNNTTNNDGASASTVTTYQPIHMCIGAGDVVAFHDTGGFVNGHYPQGIPMETITSVQGQSTDSYVGLSSTYGPSAETSTNTGAGYATEADQEIDMQVIEGTGNDAYGLCSGGYGDEPANSNAIDCDYRTSGDGSNQANPTKYPDHPFCAGPGEPIPGSNVPPSGSTGGGKSGGSGKAGGSGRSGGSGQRAVAPRLSALHFNPPLFVAKRGSTITYRDSESGLTTVRFYRVEGKKDKLVKTLHHQDRSRAGFHIGGLAPGRYIVKLTSVYRHKTGRTLSTKIRVISRR